MTNKNIIILIVGLVVAGLGIGTIYFFSQQMSPQNPTKTTTPTTTPTTTTPTNSNPVPVSQTSVPTVQTNSSTAPYISTVVVSGTVNPGGALTTYWYEFGETTSLGTKTSAYLLGSGDATLYAPAYITGLRSNTNYYFRLSANNSVGTVNGATYSFKTSTTPAPTGNTPIVNTTPATNITKTTVNLNGQINPKSSVTTYWFEYGLTSNLGAVTPSQASDNGNSSSTVLASLSNLQPLTKYYFRLNAQNQFGTVNGQILNFTTNGPAAATAPSVNTNSANTITRSSVKLNASVNPNGATTTYWFEYSNNSLLSSVVASTTPEQSLDSGTSAVNVSANANNLTNNTKYYVRVVAENQYGTVLGDIVSFTTKK
jgi:phosphodiesterase/alkaline phosphatase D-like protein